MNKHFVSFRIILLCFVLLSDLLGLTESRLTVSQNTFLPGGRPNSNDIASEACRNACVGFINNNCVTFTFSYASGRVICWLYDQQANLLKTLTLSVVDQYQFSYTGKRL